MSSRIASVAAFVKRFSVVRPHAMFWGELDAYDHANNVQYMRWFESVRANWMAEVALAASTGGYNGRELLSAKSVGFILGSAACRYKVPVEWPDTLWFGTSAAAPLPGAGADRFTLHHAVYSVRHARIAAEGEVEVVVYDYRLKKRGALPPSAAAGIAAVEAAGAQRTDAEVAALEALSAGLHKASGVDTALRLGALPNAARA